MSNWKNWFLNPRALEEQRDTQELYAQAKYARARSPLADETQCGRFLLDIIFEICARHDVATPSIPMGEALYATIQSLLYAEGFLLELPEESTLSKLTVEEGIHLRATLGRHLRFLNDHERLLAQWREKLVWLFSGILDYLPVSAFKEAENTTDDALMFPEVAIAALCTNLPEVLDRINITLVDDDVINAHLFDLARERLNDNLYVASGIPPERRDAASKVRMPSEHAPASPEHLAAVYLQGTPFRTFFEATLPFAIPAQSRLEHMHILGGTGHGKSQLIQYLLTREKGGFCVIDSQGDMIEKIARRFDNVILLDPTDVEYPLSLNMFDMKTKGEAELNATIALYEYVFSGLLGAELTQRQSLLFGSIARLMLNIPRATIHTLIDVMEYGERFKPYMQQLGGTAARFFEEQFFQKSFQANKQQIMARLYGVLENQTFDRIFSSPKNKIDFFEAMNTGKIVLINTAKSFFQSERSAIFGRFFIAMIAQAAIRRASIPDRERKPWFVYIDEFHEYVRGGDRQAEDLFNQARKYKVGLICSHQNLGQLEDKLRATIMASTAIKMAGGVSAKDAQYLAQEMRCEKEAIHTTRKLANGSEWMCSVRNLGTQKVLSHFGALEAMPERDDYDAFIADNRRKYCREKPEQSGEKVEQPEPSTQTQQTDSDGGIWG